jgi:glycosyltransferase involved in cell wall biosynthesis
MTEINMQTIRIAHISTFPPQRCGIAEYAADLVGALENVENLNFGLTKHAPTPKGCEAIVDVNSRTNLIELARMIRDADVDVVDLQHEFGIWGGDEGEHILAFLEACDRPIVSTLHTTFSPGFNEKQTNILKALLQASARAVVLTEKAEENTRLLDPQSSSKLRVIRHGVPATKFIDPPDRGASFISPGFFRPDKGLELVLAALSMLADEGLRFRHTIIGGLQADNGDQRRYKAHIEVLTRKLGISDKVTIVAEDLERDELIKHIANTDCAVLGYTNVIQASSGIIPLVLSTGRWVLCPPIEYMRATKEMVTGLIATEGTGSLELFDKLKVFIMDIDHYRRKARRIYEDTRPWIWQEIAKKYRGVFNEALG